MTTETRPVQIKPNIFDIFIGGARKGWNLATQNLVPNILMAYVIAYILNILGVMDFLGYWLGPIMGIFGLDLSKPIDLNIHAEDTNVDAVLEVLKPYMI